MTLQSTLGGKLNLAVHQCKQGMVFAHTDVFTGMNFRAALTNDDAACVDRLTAIDFDAESLCLGIATVKRSAAAFFVCHFRLLGIWFVRSTINR
jgi:hypothetical protein